MTNKCYERDGKKMAKIVEHKIDTHNAMHCRLLGRKCVSFMCRVTNTRLTREEVKKEVESRLKLRFGEVSMSINI